jgi:hypothetical protein
MERNAFKSCISNLDILVRLAIPVNTAIFVINMQLADSYFCHLSCKCKDKERHLSGTLRRDKMALQPETQTTRFLRDSSGEMTNK